MLPQLLRPSGRLKTRLSCFEGGSLPHSRKILPKTLTGLLCGLLANATKSLMCSWISSLLKAALT